MHFYEGNPINLHYALLHCLGRTQIIRVLKETNNLKTICKNSCDMPCVFLFFFGIPKFEAPHLPGFFGQIHDPIFLLDSMGMGSRLTMSYHIESVS